jgi:hypothetical protein
MRQEDVDGRPKNDSALSTTAACGRVGDVAGNGRGMAGGGLMPAGLRCRCAMSATTTRAPSATKGFAAAARACVPRR